MVTNQGDVESVSVGKGKPKSDVFWPAFGEGRLRVKLKIPKVEGEREEEMDIEEDQETGFQRTNQMNKCRNDTERLCQFCNKAFSSGQALGGHMRIHVQRATKADLVFKKKLKFHRTMEENPREDVEEKTIDFVKRKHHYEGTTTTADFCGDSAKLIEKPTCRICHKNFPSMKSLFGHMRCHPDRGWRGIHPPSVTARKSSPSSPSSDADDPPEIDDDQTELLASGEKNNRAVDLRASLSGWPVTAKRGRKATAASSSSVLSSSGDDDQLRDAVNYLMMLSRGDSFESVVTQREKFDKSEAADSCGEAGIPEIDQVSKSKITVIDRSSLGAIRNHSPVVDRPVNEEMGSNEAEKSGSGLVRGEPAIKLESQEWLDEYDERGRSADQDQMDSKSTNFEAPPIKNKKKRKKMKLCDLELTKNAGPLSTSDKYRCNTCDKYFITHQALVGHRSSHKVITRNSMVGTEAESISSPAGAAQVEETKEEDNRDTSSNSAEGAQHQFLTYNKIYPTAQATRCHGSLLEETPSSQISSHSEGGPTPWRVLNFDLNEMPPSEDIRS